MKVGLFGGSFDPVHSEHIACLKAAIGALGLNVVYLIPSALAPHKRGGSHAGGDDRLKMCEIAVREIEEARVSDYELRRDGVSYSYLTCRYFRELYPDDELYFLMGADMLEDFFTWKNPADILQNVRLAVCGREETLPAALTEKFQRHFHQTVAAVPYTGAAVSSTGLRVRLAFEKPCDALGGEVAAYIRERGLYRYPVIGRALALEKPSRREHSFRVALLACERARTLGISEEKALLAAALHDCAKSVPLSDPMLAGYRPPEGIPDPVLHQDTGAYLAEHCFGIGDGEIIDAIRYHASGREDMTKLGKLIYLADLLEESRTFEGVEELRKLFWEDLDACLVASLENQLRHLEAGGMPVYSLTRQAYRWAKSHINVEN